MIIVFIMYYIDFCRQVLPFPKTWVKEPLRELWPMQYGWSPIYWTNHLDVVCVS